MPVIGANPQQLRALARLMMAQSEGLRRMEIEVSTTLRNSSWRGTDRTAFDETWNSQLRQTLISSATMLKSSSETLKRQAAAQEQASEAGPQLPGGWLQPGRPPLGSVADLSAGPSPSVKATGRLSISDKGWSDTYEDTDHENLTKGKQNQPGLKPSLDLGVSQTVEGNTAIWGKEDTTVTTEGGTTTTQTNTKQYGYVEGSVTAGAGVRVNGDGSAEEYAKLSANGSVSGYRESMSQSTSDGTTTTSTSQTTKVGTVEAAGSVEVTSDKAKVDASAGITALDVEREVALDTTIAGNDVHLGAEGTVKVGGFGEASAEISDSGFEGNAGAYAGAKVEVTGSAEVGPVGGSATAEAWAGVGAEVDVKGGYEDGKLNLGFGIGAGLGFGGEVDFDVTIDVGAIGDAITGKSGHLSRGEFKSIWKDFN